MIRLIAQLKAMFLCSNSARACSLIVEGGVFWTTLSGAGLGVAKDASIIYLDEKQAREVISLLKISPSTQPASMPKPPDHLFRLFSNSIGDSSNGLNPIRG